MLVSFFRVCACVFVSPKLNSLPHLLKKCRNYCLYFQQYTLKYSMPTVQCVYQYLPLLPLTAKYSFSISTAPTRPWPCFRKFSAVSPKKISCASHEKSLLVIAWHHAAAACKDTCCDWPSSHALDTSCVLLHCSKLHKYSCIVYVIYIISDEYGYTWYIRSCEYIRSCPRQKSQKRVSSKQ